MKNIDPNSYELFSRIVDFSQKLNCSNIKSHSSTEKVIATEFPKLMNNRCLSDFIKAGVNMVESDALSSFPLRLEVSKAMISAQVGSKKDALSLILDSKLAGQGVNMESCQRALQFVESVDPDTKEHLKMLVVAKFPFVKDL